MLLWMQLLLRHSQKLRSTHNLIQTQIKKAREGLFLFAYLCFMARTEDDSVLLHVSTIATTQTFVIRDVTQINTVVVFIGDEPD